MNLWVRYGICTIISLGMLSLSASSADYVEEPSRWYSALHHLIHNHATDGIHISSIDVLTPKKALLPVEQCQDVSAEFTHPPTLTVGRVMVVLTCLDSEQLISRYIQVDIHARGEFLTAAHDIDAGEIISRSDIAITIGDLRQLPRHSLLASSESLAQVVGAELRRPLLAGSPLRTNLIKKPRAVNFGDELVIEVDGRGFQITRQGEALDAGAVGDTIRVKVDSRILIKAQIIAAGRVKLFP